MPIGNGPDYYTGYNKEEEIEKKLVDRVENWWNGIDNYYKCELLKDYTEENEKFEPDYIWCQLEWCYQLDVYLTENHLTEEELLAQKDWYDPDIELEERKLEEEMDYE